MGGKGSGRTNTGVAEMLRARIKNEFKLKRDKLTEEEVDKIKELRAQGLTQKAIARQLGCKPMYCMCISYVTRGQESIHG